MSLTKEERQITLATKVILTGEQNDKLLHVRRYDADRLANVNGLLPVWLNVSQGDHVVLYRLTQEHMFEILPVGIYATEVGVDRQDLNQALVDIWNNLKLSRLAGCLLPITAYMEDYP